MVPWRCATNSAGTIQWISQAEITAQIADNRDLGHDARA